MSANADLTLVLRATHFSADKHRDQRRKGVRALPYINHPIEVAERLACIGGVDNADVLAAAILHDTIEDTETTAEEIAELFGEYIRKLVLEVTDDKSLKKSERKRRQVEAAPHKSNGAKQIKLSDKISNVADMIKNPPDWPLTRKLEYLDWAEAVARGVTGVNAALDAEFDRTLKAARSQLENEQ